MAQYSKTEIRVRGTQFATLPDPWDRPVLDQTRAGPYVPPPVEPPVRRMNLKRRTKPVKA